GSSFALPQQVLDRYPGWAPKYCLDCRDAHPDSAPSEQPKLGIDQDPSSGVFTDGSASPNPGPGGWGAVYVLDDEIVAEAHGHEEHTTNNRMELTALLAALDLVPQGTAAVVYSDSNLAVRTINEWASGWEKRGWRRKTGEVENLDLVRAAYQNWRPELQLTWIKGHAGYRWNEYADELANRWRD
ncbi:MAG: ribonuclease H, partial [Acidimicrobiia bacterium]